MGGRAFARLDWDPGGGAWPPLISDHPDVVVADREGSETDSNGLPLELATERMQIFQSSYIGVSGH